MSYLGPVFTETFLSAIIFTGAFLILVPNMPLTAYNLFYGFKQKQNRAFFVLVY